MKLVKLLVALFFSAHAAHAQSPSVWDQYFDVSRSVFGDVPTRDSVLSEDYALNLLEGLDGTWVPLSFLALDQPDDVLLDRFCSTNPVVIERYELGGFTMRHERIRNENTLSWTTTFAPDIAGLFVAQLQSEADLAEFLGLEVLNRSLLVNRSGFRAVLRPSRDTLVVLGSGTDPLIYGRCPGT